jgi:hypothetical protein
MTRIKKNLAGLGTVLLFIVGVLTVSVAAPHPSPAWSHQIVKFHNALKDMGSQADTGTLKMVDVCEGTGLPTYSKRLTGREQEADGDLQHPPVVSPRIHVYTLKVSLQILHSVLIL